jgi:hypothetical protein
MTSSLKGLKLSNHTKETLGSASSSSLNNNNRNSASKSFSHDDDDERFYDASDAVDNDYGYYTPAEKLKSGKKFFNQTDDEDDRTFVFFDTPTSRHSSEISTNETNGHKSNSLKTKSLAIEEIVDDESNKIQNTNENNNNNNNNVDHDDDDDDETDAELETPWSFWVDRLL